MVNRIGAMCARVYDGACLPSLTQNEVLQARGSLTVACLHIALSAARVAVGLVSSH